MKTVYVTRNQIRKDEGFLAISALIESACFAVDAALQLVILFRICSGETKCQLRCRLVSFLAIKKAHPCRMRRRSVKPKKQCLWSTFYQTRNETSSIYSFSCWSPPVNFFIWLRAYVSIATYIMSRFFQPSCWAIHRWSTIKEQSVKTAPPCFAKPSIALGAPSAHDYFSIGALILLRIWLPFFKIFK